MELKSSIALVTGGAVRIGETICRTLAGKGCVVAVHCNRSVAAGDALVESLCTKGAKAFLVQGDLRESADCREIVRRVCSEAGGIDILVNNAAVFYKDTLLDGDEERFVEQLAVNTTAAKLLKEAFVEAHRAGGEAGREQRGGIVNILGRRIGTVDPQSLSYSISKKMLAELTRQWAVELAPEIAVNGVAPGAVLAPPGGEGERTRDSAGESPLDVQCTPGDVASAVLYLLESDALTGQIVFVDGGQHLLSE